MSVGSLLCLVSLVSLHLQSPLSVLLSNKHARTHAYIEAKVAKFPVFTAKHKTILKQKVEDVKEEERQGEVFFLCFLRLCRMCFCQVGGEMKHALCSLAN